MAKKSKFKNLIIFSIVFSLITLTGCTTYDNFKDSFKNEKDQEKKNVLYIGVYEPASGIYRNEGLDEIAGIELANSIYTNVRGYDIELIKVDNKSEAKSSKEAMKTLIDKKPIGIIGSKGEASSLIATSICEKNRIPLITPSSTNYLVTGSNKYCFRTSLTTSQMGIGLSDYIKNNKKIKRIGTISVLGDNSAKNFEASFIKTIKKDKDKRDNLTKYEIDVKKQNYKKVFKAIKKDEPEAILLSGDTKTCDKIFSGIEKNNMTDILFLGKNNFGEEDFLKMMKKHPKIKIAFAQDGVNYESFYLNKKKSIETEKFMTEMSNRYGNTDRANQGIALGYDSYLIMINAIKKAKNIDSESVRQALSETKNLKCATGIFSFDSNGDPTRSVNIMTIKNGTIEPIYVANANKSIQTIKIKK